MQAAVTAYFSSKHLLLFAFAWHPMEDSHVAISIICAEALNYFDTSTLQNEKAV